MPLYSQSIKNLVSGISQQAPIQRYAEQLEEQSNGLSTESTGLQKRPPTIFIKKLMDAIPNNVQPLVHFIDRDVNEKYIVYIFNNNIRIFDFEGNEKTVHMQDDADYINTDKPKDELRLVTIADYTFIVNTNKLIKMSSIKSPDSFNTQGALVNVKQGQYGRTYKIWVDGKEVASYTTPDGSDKSHTAMIDTHYIAKQLADNAKEAGKTVDLGDCWLRIKPASSVSTQDGFNNNAMIGVTDTVQRFSLLPATAPADYTILVKTDPNGDEAGSYYVKYNNEEKVWEECVCPNILVGLDATTMPHALVREADGSFTFKKLEWTERKVGDEDSNPLPSFVDYAISDIFFYRNRLGLLSGENVILSESGEYFNFWMTTATDILDIDPIDVATTTTRINFLNYAIPFDGELYCFSDKSQFVLRSDTTLSPRNVALVEVTGFQSSPDCRPIVAGRNLYFPAERSEFTSIKEYYSVLDTSEMKNAQDITAHVPNYIPNGVYEIEAANNENIILVLTRGNPNYIYVYKYLFMNEQRVQASWSLWNMYSRVINLYFIGSTLYLLINRGSSHVLEKMNFTISKTVDFLDKELYRVYLDCKKVATTATYDEISETTTINIKDEYELNDNDITEISVVLPDGVYKEFTEITDNIIRIDGNYQGKNIIIGLPYRFYIKLSPIYLRSTDSNGSQKALTNGRLQLRYIHFTYADTGGFVVYVTNSKDPNKKTRIYKMTARNVGTLSARLGSILEQTGEFKVPLQMLNTSCGIYVESSLPLPLALIDYSFDATWVQRSKGV